jgi:hypothetical protein
MGSAARVEWGAYESLTIIAGGTGITFGISVLENACTRMVRKHQESKWKTSRVRFVWILKEFCKWSFRSHSCTTILIPLYALNSSSQLGRYDPSTLYGDVRLVPASN